MPPPRHPDSQAALVEHREFLRSLARSLVLDEHRADDLVQQTCLALLERPPERAGSLRAWLARVVQNLAFSMLTRERDRAWRESLAAADHEVPETEEDALEQQQQLVDALRNLRQPYRTTLYLRYYRDLTPTEIAREQDVSVATVKTRLRRGLELLRTDLDRSTGGGRASWCLAMAPLAAPEGALASSATLTTPTLLKGALLMKKSVLATLSVVVLGGAASLVWLSGDGRQEQEPRVAREAPALQVPGDVPVEPLPPPAASAAVPEAEARRAPARVASPPVPAVAGVAPAGVLRGQVVDDAGAPLAGADVSLIGGTADWDLFLSMSHVDPHDLQLPGSAHGRTDAEGAFELPVGEAGTKHLAVGADYFAPYRREFLAQEGADVDLGVLQLDPGAVISGRVVDGSGRGVEGATLSGMRAEGEAQFIRFETEGVIPMSSSLATTDARGAFELRRMPVGPWRLRVESDDHPHKEVRGQTQRAGERVADLLVTLEDGYEISGTVLGIPPDLNDELKVVATPVVPGEGRSGGLLQAVTASSTRVAVDGSFRLRGLKGDRSYELRAVAADSFLTLKRRSEVQVAQPGERGVRLTYATPATLSFQVKDAESDEPITRFRVSAANLPPNMSGIGDLGDQHPDGRVRIEDFGASSAFVIERTGLTVEAVGYESHFLGAIDIQPGQEMHLGTVYLRRVPVLRVVAVDAATRKPVEGARVRLLPAREAPAQDEVVERRMRFDVDVDGGGGDPHVSVSGDDPALASAVTDADGLAVLNGAPGQRVQLEVRHGDFAPLLGESFVLPRAGDHDERVELVEGSTVEVHVVDAEGNPLPGVRVEHLAPSGGGVRPFPGSGAGGPPPTEVSDSEGMIYFENLAQGVHRFRLSESPFAGGFGPVRVSFAGAGPEEGASWSELTVEPGADLSLVLQASPRGAIVGVVTEAGLPLAGATVRLAPEGGDTPMMPGLAGSGPSATTDSKGRYRLEGFPADRYGFAITHASRHMPWRTTVDVRSGTNEVDVDLPLASIEGRITDPEGKPLAGLEVRAERSRATGGRAVQMQFVAIAVDGSGSAISIGSGGSVSATSTDADGYFELRGVLVDTPLVVKADGAGFAPAESEPLTVTAGEVREGVDLELRQAGAIDVSVVGPDGAPTGGFLVRATYEGSVEPTPEPKTGFVGPNGKALLQGCLTGAWSVRLDPVSMGAAPSASAPPPQSVEVQAAATHPLEFTVDS